MRVLVCGDRNWTDQGFLDRVLDTIHKERGPITVVIEGEARGADQMSRSWAIRRGVMVMRFPADWRRYGRAAGAIRNRQQFNEGRPDLVVAFHNDIRASKGTKDMVEYAKSKNCPIEVWSSHKGSYDYLLKGGA